MNSFKLYKTQGSNNFQLDSTINVHHILELWKSSFVLLVSIICSYVMQTTCIWLTQEDVSELHVGNSACQYNFKSSLNKRELLKNNKVIGLSKLSKWKVSEMSDENIIRKWRRKKRKKANLMQSIINNTNTLQMSETQQITFVTYLYY